MQSLAVNVLFVFTFDIVLEPAFDSWEALAAYAEHEHGFPALDLVRKIC